MIVASDTRYGWLLCVGWLEPLSSVCQQWVRGKEPMVDVAMCPTTNCKGESDCTLKARQNGRPVKENKSGRVDNIILISLV